MNIRHAQRLAVVAASTAFLAAFSVAASAQTPVDGFNPGATSIVRIVARQPDGKILVAGQFDLLGGGTGTTFRRFIGRLNADGTLDTSFDPGANGFVYAMVLQPDGKILVSGDFSMLGGGGSGNTVRNHIGRLNANGSLDTGFDPGANSSVARMALQADGKIVVGGTFTTIGGGGTGTVARSAIARLNANGSVDESFNPIFNGFVVGLVVQPDGKIVVGGQFNLFGPVGATVARNHLARLNSDGSLDATFNPGCNEEVLTMNQQPDGKILVGGDFTACGGGRDALARNHIVRINPDGSLDTMFSPSLNGRVWSIVPQADGRLLVGGAFTGIRNGLLRLDATGALDYGFNPGANNIVYALLIQPDGMIVVGGDFTMLGGGGTGTTPRRNIGRVTGNGVAVAGMIQNGTFTNGATGWQIYEPPDIVSSVVSGVFHYFKANPATTESGQAVVFQETGQPMPSGAPLVAQFDLGNSSSVRKRVSVLLIDSNFSDLSVCTFWLAPAAPLRTYMMRMQATKPWANAAIYFYAATGGQDGGEYLIDNVMLESAPGQSHEGTECVDPTRPVAPGGASSANLIINGNFSAPTIAPWSLFGDLTQRVNGGVFEFTRPGTPGQPAGVVLQPTGQAIAANSILTASFDLGNSSTVRKRVTVLAHDLDFSDLMACTFWLAPGEPLSTYTMRGFATRAWTNATISVYAATTGTEAWMRLDNVTLQRTPGIAAMGTECIAPVIGPAPFAEAAPMDDVPSFATMAVQRTTSSGSTGFTADGEDTNGSVRAWRVDARTTGRSVLRWASPVDLTSATTGVISFQSWLSSGASSAEVQVSRDGDRWESAASVPATDGWQWIDVDLNAWLGEAVFVRLVFTTVSPQIGVDPDVWRIEDVSVSISTESSPLLVRSSHVLAGAGAAAVDAAARRSQFSQIRGAPLRARD